MQITSTIIAAFGLVGLAAAAPTTPAAQAQGCSLFPWFIAPYANNQSCQGSPAYYQPTSGPYNPNPTSTGCRPLYDPNGPPQSFQSVSINREACPQQKWEIRLYTDGACTSKPVIVNSNVCVASPGITATTKFTSFQAIPLK